MRAYAAATATTATFETIRDAATPGVGNKPAWTTTLPWRDILTRLWLLDPVQAWLPTNNKLNELAAADKHHLADPALAARLLNVTAGKLLSGGGVVGLEVKLSAVVNDGDVKHLNWLRDRIGDQLLDAVLVNTGNEAYRRPDGIAVIPAALLGP